MLNHCSFHWEKCPPFSLVFTCFTVRHSTVMWMWTQDIRIKLAGNRLSQFQRPKHETAPLMTTLSDSRKKKNRLWNHPMFSSVQFHLFTLNWITMKSVGSLFCSPNSFFFLFSFIRCPPSPVIRPRQHNKSIHKCLSGSWATWGAWDINAFSRETDITL